MDAGKQVNKSNQQQINEHTRLDLGVDPKKSTRPEVESVLHGAIDSKLNVELKSDFTASRLKTDFCLCTSGPVVSF